MSMETNSKSKGGRPSTSANHDMDSIMPLLFATIGNQSISFKKMAAMDELGRSESSFEHKFRKWRQKGREIAAQNPENAATLGTSSAGTATTKKPRAPAKNGDQARGKKMAERAGVEDEEGTYREARAVKRKPDKLDGIGRKMLHPSIEEEVAATSSTKKRTASVQAAPEEREVGEVPAKKAKVAKKGPTEVMGKVNAKVCPGGEEQVPIQLIGKSKGGVAAASGDGEATGKPHGFANVKELKTVMAAEAGRIPSHDEADADDDVNSGNDHQDGFTDMQFELAA